MRNGAQLFLCGSFFWTTFIAVAMYLETKSDVPLQHIPRRMIASFHILGWGYPIVMTVILMMNPGFVDRSKAGWYDCILFLSYCCTRCDLRHLYKWVFWFIPLLIAVVLNMIIYLLLLQRLKATWGFFSDKKSLMSLKLKFR
jgi:hypothetical protein